MEAVERDDNSLGMKLVLSLPSNSDFSSGKSRILLMKLVLFHTTQISLVRKIKNSSLLVLQISSSESQAFSSAKVYR